MVNETKKSNNYIIDSGLNYITFSDGTNTNTFLYAHGMIYYNKIAICKSVSDFKINRETSDNGKDTFKVFVTIEGVSYTTKYTI